MKEFCLIGEHLPHSYSKLIHEEFGYKYDLVELSPNELEGFVKRNDYGGYNVTIPYKTQIMPYLDSLDESASVAKSVNTVIKKNGLSIGYNTDVMGLSYLLSSQDIKLYDKKILILGSGGTSKTAVTLSKIEKAKEITVISRSGDNTYDNISDFYGYEIIINTTPVGMYPNNGQRILDISPFTRLEAVIDVIYNPLITDIMFQAKDSGIKTASGLMMLVAQAKFARDLFLNNIADNAIIEKVYNKLYQNTLNYIFIGMPSSGKTTVGKALALDLNRTFIDIDLEIEKNQNTAISEIFSSKGEAYFRSLEKELCQKYAKEKRLVISVGGGAPMQQNMYQILKQNAVIIHVLRDLSLADTTGRPLLKDKNALASLFEKRMPTYKLFADITIENNQDLQDTIKELREKLNEYFSN